MDQVSTRVGAAHVELGAETSQFNAGIDSAQQKVEQFAVKAEVATDRAGGGFNRLGSNIRNTIRPLTSLVGSLTAAIGTFGLFVNIGQRVGRSVSGIGEDGLTQSERDKLNLQNLAKQNLQNAAGLSTPPGQPNKEQADALDRAAKRAQQIREAITKLRGQTAVGEREFKRRGLTTTHPDILDLGSPKGYSRIANYLADLPLVGGFFAGESEFGPSKLQRAKLAEKRGISKGQFLIEELQDELSDINLTSSALTGSRQQLSRSRARSRPRPQVQTISGDAEAVRLLRGILLQSQRRGADE